MTWSTSPEGHAEFTAADGSRMRIVAPEAGSPHKFWRLQSLHSGSWIPSGIADGADDARNKIEAIVRHRADVVGLGRVNVALLADKPVRTPWGGAQDATRYAEGIVRYHTAGHGGFKLSASANARVHEAWRIKGGWYEEDCDWAICAVTFPDAFTAYELQNAVETLKNAMPHQYMAATGETVAPSESSTLRTEHHNRVHADDWMAVSAAKSDDHPGFTMVTATIGGERGGETRVFLVPTEEYGRDRELSFVVDLARHEEIVPTTGPTP